MAWARFFDSQRPVELDIGCGMGRFILARARRHPATQYLGIEREAARIARIDLAARREGLDNLRLLQCDAVEAVQQRLPSSGIQAAYVFFPDPWPKRKHHKRRLFSPSFVEGLVRILIANGQLHVATDHLDYFARIRATLDADPRFAETMPLVREPDEQTDFEVIFRRKDLPIGEVSYRKTLDRSPA